ncbi:type II toxin-antitoxin system YafQ family toxin [Limosilactobacillus sp.]|uniref:type II toxin-antitoxin system RelE/ParE family toxin n=1 Tax=Limosilactobacillus sp. TaxID=2773925 RepID=UPI0035A12E91
MKIQSTNQFERQLKRLAKKHYPIKALKPCIHAIVEQNIGILNRIKDHGLKGKWLGYREFHPARIKNYGKQFDNWIVIYTINSHRILLTLVATGGHDILG